MTIGPNGPVQTGIGSFEIEELNDALETALTFTDIRERMAARALVAQRRSSLLSSVPAMASPADGGELQSPLGPLRLIRKDAGIVQSPPTGLTIVGAPDDIVQLSAVAPVGPHFSYLRFFSSWSSNFANALPISDKLYTTPGDARLYPESGHAGTRYYWAKAYSETGRESAAAGPVSATVGVFDFSDESLSPGASVLRSTDGLYYDASMALTTAAPNTPRFEHSSTTGTYFGLMNEPSGFNYVPNNTGQGVAPGDATLPTSWQMPNVVSGMATQIVGRSRDNGIDYVDIRFYGTPATTGQVTLRPEQNSTEAVGSTWTNSIFLAVVAGSLANVTGMQLRAGSEAGSTGWSNVSATLKRYINTRTLTGTLPTLTLRWNYLTAGTATDFTLRIGLPQRESGATASSPIRTSGAAAARSADQIRLNWGTRGVADGQIKVRYTFDNDSTQDGFQSVSGGLGVVPSGFSRIHIRKVELIPEWFDFTNGALPAGAALKRPSVASRRNAAGVLDAVPVDQPRLDYAPSTLAPNGIIVEPGTTQYIPNSIMVGAATGDLSTTGRLPDNWSAPYGGQGVSREITALGVIDGMEYFDIRFFGTSTGTSLIILQPPFAGAIAAVGDTWSNSVYLALVAGSLANITGFVLRAGSEGGGTSLAGLNSTLTRYTNIRTLTSADGRLIIRWNWSAVGAPIDFTMRVALPQTEFGSRVTSPIETGKNRVQVPEDATSSYWGKTDISVAANAAVDPFGSDRMALITGTGSSELIRSSGGTAISVTPGATYTYSVYVKRGNFDFMRMLAMSSTSSTDGVRLWANLATGVITSSSPIGTGWSIVGTPQMQNVGGGIYRLSISFVAGGSVVYVSTLSAAGNGSGLRADVGGGQGIGTRYYWFGAQVEAGAAATEYVSNVRSADVLTLDWKSKGVPDGILPVRYTFDDNSTQDSTMKVDFGKATVPTDLNRPTIKMIAPL